jgi:hypothetical protein
MERTSCVLLKDEAQKGFAVSATSVRKGAPLYNYAECGDKKYSFHALIGLFEILRGEWA